MYPGINDNQDFDRVALIDDLKAFADDFTFLEQSIIDQILSRQFVMQDTGNTNGAVVSPDAGRLLVTTNNYPNIDVSPGFAFDYNGRLINVPTNPENLIPPRPSRTSLPVPDENMSWTLCIRWNKIDNYAGDARLTETLEQTQYVRLRSSYAFEWVQYPGTIPDNYIPLAIIFSHNFPVHTDSRPEFKLLIRNEQITFDKLNTEVKDGVLILNKPGGASQTVQTPVILSKYLQINEVLGDGIPFAIKLFYGNLAIGSTNKTVIIGPQSLLIEGRILMVQIFRNDLTLPILAYDPIATFSLQSDGVNATVYFVYPQIVGNVKYILTVMYAPTHL